MSKDSCVKEYHLLTLYSLFVDLVSYRVQNNLPVNTLSELRRLHYDISPRC